MTFDVMFLRRTQRRPELPQSDNRGCAAPGPSVARVRRLTLLVVIFTRLLGLTVLTADVAFGWYRNGLTPGVAVFTSVVITESCLFMATCWLRGEASRLWAGADAILIGVGLVTFASQTSKPFDPWTFMFQFSLISAVITGVSFRRLGTALLWECVPMAAYAATALLERDAGWNVPQDLVNYIGVVIVAWVVTDQMRRSAGNLDEAQSAALAQEAALATERERSRSLRLLHDSVLQTLETLARGPFIDDETILAQVRRDAFWLRRLVQGAPASKSADGEDLGAALAAAIENHIAAGLRVRLYADDIGAVAAPAVIEAVTAAVSEALTNVRKHAGTASAAVRAASEDGDGIKVSVVDAGCGFDTGRVAAGTGLRESITRRLEQVGGRVQVDSAPGSGTCIAMWIPATPRGDGSSP